MIRRAAVLAAAALAPAPAHAGAGAPPPVALTASPAHVLLYGAGRTTIQVVNRGAVAVAVDVLPAGFTLDVRGRPAVTGRSSTAGWLQVTPRRLALAPGGRAAVGVSSVPPRGATPGDHAALVLLSTRPVRTAALAVRMRLGVSVVMRVPGVVRRRVELRSLRVDGRGAGRTLRLGVANTGNVIERLGRGRITVALIAGGRVRARLQPLPRALLPRSSGICELRYGGGLRGWVTARVTLAAAGSGTVLRRSFRIRL